MASKEHALNDLIKLLNSGREFYQQAEHEVSDQRLSEIFQSMAKARESSVAELQPYAATSGRSHSAKAEVRKAYTTMLAALRKNPNNLYINQLEEIEDETLDAIDEALQEHGSSSDELGAALLHTRERMAVCHQRMSELQRAAAH